MLGGIISLVVSFLLRLRTTRGDPPIPDDRTVPTPPPTMSLGGWLILVGIGVVLGPIILLARHVPEYLLIFGDGTWELLTTVGTEAYLPLWGALLIGEIVFNSGLFAASICLIYLFFPKHYLFPRFYIAVLAVSIVFIPFDSLLVKLILPDEPVFDPETVRGFARALASGLVWIPYMLVSRRVKATFVEKMPTGKSAQGVGS